jgi:hypothetical protein
MWLVQKASPFIGALDSVLRKGWRGLFTVGEKGIILSENYAPLEKYLRDLSVSQEDIITFESIEQILKGPLPRSAREEYTWWDNQKQGMQVETNAWMDAGWMVERVNFSEKWAEFVKAGHKTQSKSSIEILVPDADILDL